MARHRYRDILDIPTSNRRIGDQSLKVFLSLHATLLAVINVLGSLIQWKNQSSKGSPSDEQEWTMLAVIVALLIYGLILLQEFNLRSQNSIHSEILAKHSLLSGLLVTILLVLMLKPILGWMLFAIWVTFFLKASLDLREGVYRLTCGAALRVLDLLSEFLMGRGLMEERAGLPV